MMNKIKVYAKEYKRFLVILVGIVILNALYGFDIRFTIINLLWVFINVVKL